MTDQPTDPTEVVCEDLLEHAKQLHSLIVARKIYYEDQVLSPDEIALDLASAAVKALKAANLLVEVDDGPEAQPAAVQVPGDPRGD